MANRTVPFLRPALGLLLCVTSFGAHAAYKVEIDAPRSLKKLLTEFLDLERYKDRTDLDAAQFDFMITTLPEQVAKLTATQGYFTPKTTVRVERPGGSAPSAATGSVANADASPGMTTGTGSGTGSGTSASTGAGTGTDTVGKIGAAIVHVAVDPGRRTTIGKLDLTIDGPAVTEAPAQVAEARAAWKLPSGAPFTQDDWAASKQASLNVLRADRYAAAELRSAKASITPEQAQAALEAHYDTGPTFTLGPVNIEGTRRYPEQIIRNINPLREGEVFSENRLLELQRMIQKTPYFSNAAVDIARDRANPLLAPVSVKVGEFPTQQIRGGAGYTTDTGAHVDGVYSHNNVFGKAWVFESQLRLEQRRQIGSLDLSMPPGPGAWVNNGHVSFERTTLQGVDLRSRRAGVRRARNTENNDFAYTLEYYSDQLRQVDGATLPPDTVVQPGAHQAVVAGVSWTHRRLDSLQFPRRGHIVTVELGVAAKGLLTDQTFLRGYTRGQQYFPVGKRDLVLLRAELGAFASKGGNASIPASLLFRAGGTDSVRGYSYQSIGNDINGTVYPTRYLATGSAEYQHWFNETWGAAAFYDVGTATDSWNDKQFFQAVGGGARWHSPVGTINADLGYGIQRHQIRPHLSLGVSF